MNKATNSFISRRSFIKGCMITASGAFLCPLLSAKDISLLERYRGSLLGLATVDALGTTLEFKSPGSFEPINDIVGGGPFHLKAGQWTDDTSMALCLAESLIETGGFNPSDQMKRYVRWYREGHLSSNGVCFDIGGTVRKALELFEETGEPYCGSTDPKSSGNGSIMRLSPAVLLYRKNPDEAIEKAKDSSRTTHGSSICLDGCRYFASLILGTLNGVSKEELLSKHYSIIVGYWKKHPLVPEIDEIAAGSFKEKNPPEIKGTGYVAACLEAALWAFYKSNSFKEGALMAVNLGDDADTTGAVYGQLAGAYYGERNIPKKWLSILAYRELICDFAVKIFNMSEKIH